MLYVFRSLVVALLLTSLTWAGTAVAVPIDRGQQIQSWLKQLDDPAASTRTEALASLQGLTKLEMQQLIAEGLLRKLTPSQVLAMGEVYQYVQVRSTLDFTKSHNGFMGVSLDNADPFSADGAGGALISGRIIGFVAYRYLCDGDIVVGIGDHETKQAVRNGDDLRNFVLTHRPGDILTFVVVRGGQSLTVSFPIDSRPVMDPANTDDNAVTRSIEAQQLSIAIEAVRRDAERGWQAQMVSAISERKS